MIGWLKERRVQIAVACFVWIAVTVASLWSVWRPIDLAAYDWLTVLTAPRVPDSPVVIVGIDEDSFAELGRQWPWPRSVHAQLVERLAKAGAAVIAFDIVFTEPSDADADRRFAEAIRQAGNVVLAAVEKHSVTSYVAQRIRIDPMDQFVKVGATVGLTNLNLDTDNVLRHVSAYADNFWQSVLKVYKRKERAAFHSIPPASLIRYVGPHSFPYVSYYQALDPETFLPPGMLKGRIVLIGFDVGASPVPEQRQTDAFATPFLRVSDQLTPGVEILANVIEDGLHGRVITEVPLWGRSILLLIVVALSFRAMSPWRPVRSALLGVVASVVLIGLSGGLFAFLDIWLPTAVPVVGLGLLYVAQGGVAFLKEQARARFIRSAFSKYVSSDIVDYMLENPDRLILGGERREVTFIFTDVAGFTTLSEDLDAETLVSLVKNYFEGMGETILTHHGTIERFAGDGLVALFNAPVDQSDHALRAVTCALELDSFAQDFAAKCVAQGIRFGHTRIGINTGDVTVGNFGSSKRFHYTAMGDPINTAARLESANKYFGTRVCVSGATASRCREIAFRPIGEVLLKGKERAILVFEPLTKKCTAKPEISVYQTAYELMRAGDPNAAKAFESGMALDPDDPLIAFHLNRLRRGETGVRIKLADK